jgi:hypothetical protein
MTYYEGTLANMLICVCHAVADFLVTEKREQVDKYLIKSDARRV